MKKMSDAEAMIFIDACQREERRIYGLDGFIPTSRGYIASLDLILDLSSEHISIDDAAKKAREFILKNGGANFLYEVVAE